MVLHVHNKIIIGVSIMSGSAANDYEEHNRRSLCLKARY